MGGGWILDKVELLIDNGDGVAIAEFTELRRIAIARAPALPVLTPEAGE
jgi:hypothetical protein